MFVQEEISNATYEYPMTLISFAVSMAVNTLVTGLIVFEILKVFLGVKPTSVERVLGAVPHFGISYS